MRTIIDPNKKLRLYDTMFDGLHHERKGRQPKRAMKTVNCACCCVGCGCTFITPTLSDSITVPTYWNSCHYTQLLIGYIEQDLAQHLKLSNNPFKKHH